MLVVGHVGAFEIGSAIVLVLALVHVFLSSHLIRLAHRFPTHAGLLHLLGEVEVVFGFWAMILFIFRWTLQGRGAAVNALEGLDFREPLFVFSIMVMAGSRPVLQAASDLVALAARVLPFPGAIAHALVALGVAPLLGSLVSEPAAMTVAALLLRDSVMIGQSPPRLRYAALAVLFVNVSIGGVLTSYAAPPVLMVASRWGWDTVHMATTFGLRSVVAVAFNASVFALLFRKELSALRPERSSTLGRVPVVLVAAHLGLVALAVVFGHHTVLFMGIFLLFLGIAHAYARWHSRLLLREGLLVGFFLAGLVVVGAPQSWWLGPLVSHLDQSVLYLGTAALTSVIDNAALTYMGSLVPDTSEAFRYFLVAGAVAGGGLTVVANAPNPAGASLLRDRLPGGAITHGTLLAWALLPTAVALLAFGL
jgi:hypothetical protein